MTAAFHSVLERLERKIRGERDNFEGRLEDQQRQFNAELKGNENKLKTLGESEERFRAIVERSSHGIVVHRDGCPLFANPATAEMLGYDHTDDILALSSIADFIYEDDVVLIRNLWTRRMQGEEMPEVVGYRWQRTDGTVISVEVRATTIEWNGEPAVLAAVYDTTEQKSGEYAVRQSAARLRRLIETIPYGVQENDIEGTITYGNPAIAAIFGYDIDERVGKKIWDFLADDKQREALKENFANLVAEEPTPEPYFSESLTKDGRRIHVRSDWSYIRSQTGHLLGFTSILTDITESKRAQQALERSEAHFRTLAEASTQGITVVQGDRLMFANPAAVQMLGYDSLEAFMRVDSVDEFVHPDDVTFIRNRRLARLRNEDVPHEYVLRLLAVDGRTVTVENRVTTIEWDGEPAVFSIYNDITQRKSTARALELAD